MEARSVAPLACVAILAAATVVIWSAVFRTEEARGLTVSFLNVGQGDAAYIESPTGRQVLIDGGPDRSVLRELSRVAPWWDRSLDVVVATHPDADHVTGLVDVLQRYRVSLILQPGVRHDTPQAESLLLSVSKERGAVERLARRGDVVDLGGGAYLEVLFPDRDVSALETNTASIVARLVYGKTAFMLTGDSPKGIEEYLVALDGAGLRADVLKAGHHGSNTSSALLFAGFVSPSFVVYSRGCGNRYGHPHAEVRELFSSLSVAEADTCEDGRVTFESDGEEVRRVR